MSWPRRPSLSRFLRPIRKNPLPTSIAAYQFVASIDKSRHSLLGSSSELASTSHPFVQLTMRDIEPSCSLFAIPARDGRSAAVLRRGPSKQVQLIRWWLTSDTFEDGQWFKGRIYERRCDLSPNGERFAYFAQDFGRAPGSWTAVSKPPFLTALALWPKGDCWGGGALFESETTLLLNHRPGGESKLDSSFRLPRQVKIKQLGDHSGWGEDDPINHYRLIRDGWLHLQEGSSRRAADSAPISYPFDPIEIYAKPHPAKLPVTLLQITLGLGVTNGPWYKQDYALLPQRKETPAGRIQRTEIERQALFVSCRLLVGGLGAKWRLAVCSGR